MHRRGPHTRSQGNVVDITDTEYISRLDYKIDQMNLNKDNPYDSDSGSEDSNDKDDMRDNIFDENAPHTNHSGFLMSFIWSILTITLSPLLFLDSLIRGTKNYRYPLGCKSRKWLFIMSILNITTILSIFALSFWFFCDRSIDVPTWGHLSGCSLSLRDKLNLSLNQCLTGLSLQSGISDQCVDFPVQVIGIISILLLMVNFHKSWVKHILVLIFVGLLADWIQIQQYFQNYQEIETIDPPYALVNEEIMISLDGRNLHEGSIISWVPYWACARSNPPESCVHYGQAFLHNGAVLCNFTFVDSFVPCISASKEGASMKMYNQQITKKDQEIKCFPDIKLRVKEEKNFPGWSFKTN